MLFLVTQRPKGRNRGHLQTVVMVVDCQTRAQALVVARDQGKTGGEDWFGPSPDYCQPQAEQLPINTAMSF